MNLELERMRVVIEGEAKSFIDASRKAKAEAKSLSDNVKKEMDQVKQSMKQSTDSSWMKEFQNMKNLIKSTVKDTRNGMIPVTMVDGVKNYVKQAQLAAGVKVHTDEYKRVQEDIVRADKTLEKLQTKQREMSASGVKKDTEEYKKLESQIRSTTRARDSYEGNRLRMEGTGADVQFANTGGFTSGLSNAVSSTTAVVKQMRESIANAFANIPGIGKVTGIISKAFGGMKSVFDRVSPAIRKTSGAFASLLQKFISGIPVIGRLISGQRALHKSSNGLSGGIFKLGNMFKLMVLRMGIRSVINGMREGFQNLAQYSDSANSSISLLMSSLLQLKNSFAVAFAPILDVVAPILNSFIQKIISVANAIGQLMAALTGKGTFVRAVKVQKNYADSLGKTAGSAGKAAKGVKAAGEEARRSVLGFDQLNKLDDHSQSNSGGGSGGGAGGLSPNDMFETVEVSSSFKSFSEKLKEAWKAADFTEIGQIVGNKLNDALEKINWNKIRETSRKIARSIATFLNGFVEATDWGLVGYTFANGINTFIDFGYEAVSTFEWRKFGLAISQFINSSVENLELGKLAKSISNFVKGILDTFIQSVGNTDWKKVGKKIADALSKIDWKGIAKKLFEAIGTALGGLAAFLQGLIEGAWKKVVKWWHDVAYEDGKFTILGLLKGIVDALASIAIWIKNNIFDPIIKGFKQAFGIHSPSTVMAEQGHFIIEGLLKGITDTIGLVLSWFAQLPGKVKNSLGNAKSWLVDKGKDAISGMKSGWDLAWSSFSTFLKGIPSKIGSAIGSLWTIGKNAIKSFIDGFKSLKIPTPHFKVTGKFSIAGVETPIPKIGVSWYAKGGFPTAGEMFIARERGPELVGRMGNRNTVANNNQIIEGIKAGVFEAVMDAFSAGAFFGNDSDNKNIVLEFTFKCDSETLYRITRKGKEKYDGRYLVFETV